MKEISTLDHFVLFLIKEENITNKVQIKNEVLNSYNRINILREIYLSNFDFIINQSIIRVKSNM